METNENAGFLQPHPIVVTDAVLEINTVVIAAVMSLDDEHLSETNSSSALPEHQQTF